MSATVDQIERPLMTPDEVMRLRPAKKRGRGAKERIVAPGNMLIFVSGQYPIYGTQILYFKDPVLAKRASLPAPTTFVSIEDRGVVPQPRLDRTRNVISAPEPRPALGAAVATPARAELSPMEKAFLHAMGDPPDAALSTAPSTSGFIEQLDRDLHETELQ